MKSVLLNDNGDIEFDESGYLKMVEDTDEVLQRNKIALSINQGEWIFNINLGIPWIEYMRDKFKDVDEYVKEVETKLNTDEDIEEITNIDAEYDRGRRILTIEFEGRLINGDRFTEEVGVE